MRFTATTPARRQQVGTSTPTAHGGRPPRTRRLSPSARSTRRTSLPSPNQPHPRSDVLSDHGDDNRYRTGTPNQSPHHRLPTLNRGPRYGGRMPSTSNRPP